MENIIEGERKEGRTEGRGGGREERTNHKAETNQASLKKENRLCSTRTKFLIQER